MRGNNVVGVLFSNVHDDKIRELTERRTIASDLFWSIKDRSFGSTA